MVIQTTLTSPDKLELLFGHWTLDRLVAYLSGVKGVRMRRTKMAQILSQEGLR